MTNSRLENVGKSHGTAAKGKGAKSKTPANIADTSAPEKQASHNKAERFDKAESVHVERDKSERIGLRPFRRKWTKAYRKCITIETVKLESHLTSLRTWLLYKNLDEDDFRRWLHLYNKLFHTVLLSVLVFFVRKNLMGSEDAVALRREPVWSENIAANFFTIVERVRNVLSTMKADATDGRQLRWLFGSAVSFLTIQFLRDLALELQKLLSRCRRLRLMDNGCESYILPKVVVRSPQANACKTSLGGHAHGSCGHFEGSMTTAGNVESWLEGCHQLWTASPRKRARKNEICNSTSTDVNIVQREGVVENTNELEIIHAERRSVKNSHNEMSYKNINGTKAKITPRDAFDDLIHGLVIDLSIQSADDPKPTLAFTKLPPTRTRRGLTV